MIFAGRCQRFLSLNHFHVVSDSCAKPVFGLLHLFVGKLDRALRNLHTIGCGFQIQECTLDFVINLAFQILEFGFASAKVRIRL